MEKITIKELIEFRGRQSGKLKNNFAFKLKTRKPKEKLEDAKDSGGNYWAISTSSIYNTFKSGKDEYYDTKIDDVILRQANTDSEKDKVMYQRNLDVLNNFKEFDLHLLRPLDITNFETVHKEQKIILINSLPIYINPSLVFCFERNGKKEIGAIALIPQLGGYQKSQLGMFCEMLYKFLYKHYSSEFQIAEDFCIAIDTYNAQKIIYLELLTGKIPRLVDITVDELKSL
jgi:hypothetical protein